MKHQSRIPNRPLVIFSFALLFALIFTSFTVAFAQSSTPTDDEVNAIARKLYCPVCESTPLDVCSTQACHEWRELIRSMLAEGKSEQEILQHFENQYGARVLAEPPKKGFYWLIYIIPPAFILAGAVILLRSMKQWTNKAEPETTASPDAPADDYLARMEAELKKQK